MFFIRKNNRSAAKDSSKRKLKGRLKPSSHKGKDSAKKLNAGSLDEEISSDSDVEDVTLNREDAEQSSSEEETVPEKRLRLAKQYLEEIEKEERDRAETKALDRDVIAHRLKEDVLEQAGKLRRNVADLIQSPSVADIKSYRGHRLSITCLVISPDDKFIYSASKDAAIIKWCQTTGKRLKVIPGLKKNSTNKTGHAHHILCLGLSSDNKYLASGCRNKIINIWNPETMEFIHTFKGHRDAISGLVFRRGTHQLYSASHDRSVKIWNLDEMAYVETLFGHQDAITAIDALSRERAITSGGRDNTLRIWKIVEESQLVFNGHTGSIDCVRLINEEHFLSCGDDGVLALWGVLKKKPLASVPKAHGCDPTNGLPNWVISVAALPNSNLIASGSSDGFIRLWKCGDGLKSLHPLLSIDMKGHVNALQFTSDGSALVAGIGQEHRLGRWFINKEAKNIIAVLPLKIRPQQ